MAGARLAAAGLLAGFAANDLPDAELFLVDDFASFLPDFLAGFLDIAVSVHAAGRGGR
ncbi:MAG: hypothetical protein HY056_02115 [Proteobacteria bacterium]|nr:hypothetical protein [Pseudomonadota bacterium]